MLQEMLYQLRKMHSLLRQCLLRASHPSLSDSQSAFYPDDTGLGFLLQLCSILLDASHRWESAQIMTSTVVHSWLPHGTTERHEVLYHQGCLTTIHLRDASGL